MDGILFQNNFISCGGIQNPKMWKGINFSNNEFI